MKVLIFFAAVAGYYLTIVKSFFFFFVVLLNDTTVAFISVHNFFYNVMIKLKFSHLSCIAAFVLSIVHEIPSCIIFHQMPCKIILWTYWVHLNY